MNYFEKSIQALDALLEKLSKEEMNQIIAEIDAMSATGQTVFDYFEKFEDQFEVLQNSQDCWLIDNLPDLETIHYTDEQVRTEEIIELRHSKRFHYEVNIDTCNNNILPTDLPLAA